jgi:hypothetical protein
MIFDRDPGLGEDDADGFAEFHNLLYGPVPAPTEEESQAMFDETLSSADIDHTARTDLDGLLDSPDDHMTDDHQDAVLDGFDGFDSFDGSDGPSPESGPGSSPEFSSSSDPGFGSGLDSDFDSGSGFVPDSRSDAGFSPGFGPGFEFGGDGA